jgi:hypothetical protein
MSQGRTFAEKSKGHPLSRPRSPLVPTRGRGVSPRPAARSTTTFLGQLEYGADRGNSSALTGVAGVGAATFDFAKIPIQGPLQPKLAIGHVDDPLEEEADRVADRVMRTPGAPPGDAPVSPFWSDPPVVASIAGDALQRTCASCDDESRLQRKRAGACSRDGGDVNESAAPPIVHEVLRSPGQTLDATARAFMEARFGRSFADVRIHADHHAAKSANAANAKAYTVGQHIAFADGSYAPRSPDGARLLAHELTHVVQQEARRVPANVPRPALQRHRAPIRRRWPTKLRKQPGRTARHHASAPRVAEAGNSETPIGPGYARHRDRGG